MYSPLEEAKSHIRASEDSYDVSEIALLRDAIRSLIQYGEDVERELIQVKQRLNRIEAPDRPPSGLQPTMGDE